MDEFPARGVLNDMPPGPVRLTVHRCRQAPSFRPRRAGRSAFSFYIFLFTSMTLPLLATSAAGEQVRYVSGTGGILSPSIGSSYFVRGPIRVSTLVRVDASKPETTHTGNPFTLPADALTTAGHIDRVFPEFAFIVQTSLDYATRQPFSERLEPGAGAAASGGIDFCPPRTGSNPFDGNLACTAYSAPGAGNLPIRIGIDQRRTTTSMGAPGEKLGRAFGGTLRLARNITNASNWFAIPPYVFNMTDMQRVSRSPQTQIDYWTPGQQNFAFQTHPHFRGP